MSAADEVEAVVFPPFSERTVLFVLLVFEACLAPSLVFVLSAAFPGLFETSFGLLSGLAALSFPLLLFSEEEALPLSSSVTESMAPSPVVASEVFKLTSFS